MKRTSVSPPNSLLLVMDPAVGEIPKKMGQNCIAATGSCVAIGCRMEQDGPTEINLGQLHEIAPLGELLFDGEIPTPSRRISICSVMNEGLLSSAVGGVTVRVRVFVNDPKEPDVVFVLLCAGA